MRWKMTDLWSIAVTRSCRRLVTVVVACHVSSYVHRFRVGRKDSAVDAIDIHDLCCVVLSIFCEQIMVHGKISC